MTISIGFGLGIIYTQNIVSAGGTPVNTVAPSIAITAGGGYAGSTYTATPGTWDTGSPTGQWYADGVAISGETASTYVMTLAKEGTVIKYRETNSAVTADSNTIEMWIPADATGTLVALMDIRQGLTVASTLVSRWDSQANSVYADQSVGGLQPVYSATSFSGTPGITFGGAAEVCLENLNINGQPTNRTVIFGINHSSIGSFPSILGPHINGNFLLYYKTGQLAVTYPAASARFNATGALSTSTPYIQALKANCVTSGAYAFKRNGLADGSGTSAAISLGTLTDWMYIGRTSNAGNYLIATMASLLIWDSYLSDADIIKAEGWLAHTTYNSLDAGHTYYAAGPTI